MAAFADTISTMFSGALYLLRILVVLSAAGFYGLLTGKLSLPAMFDTVGTMPLAMGAVALGVLWSATEMLSRNPPPATDIHALGVTLYQIVTGRPPFEGDDVIGQVLMDDPPPPSKHFPAIPPALEAIILKCMKKAPEKRFPSCLDLRRALAAAIKEITAAGPTATG